MRGVLPQTVAGRNVLRHPERTCAGDARAALGKPCSDAIFCSYLRRPLRWHSRCNDSVANLSTTESSTMNTSKVLLSLAVSSLLGTGLASVSTSAVAADDMEQCAGVVKAGKNDCATSTNACHGHVEADSSPEAWIYLPKGTCDRIVGARVVQVVDPTPKK
jgi:uncharacterized membrane protein